MVHYGRYTGEPTHADPGTRVEIWTKLGRMLYGGTVRTAEHNGTGYGWYVELNTDSGAYRYVKEVEDNVVVVFPDDIKE